MNIHNIRHINTYKRVAVSSLLERRNSLLDNLVLWWVWLKVNFCSELDTDADGDFCPHSCMFSKSLWIRINGAEPPGVVGGGLAKRESTRGHKGKVSKNAGTFLRIAGRTLEKLRSVQHQWLWAAPSCGCIVQHPCDGSLERPGQWWFYCSK